jgi:hypothetical protein
MFLQNTGTLFQKWLMNNVESFRSFVEIQSRRSYEQIPLFNFFNNSPSGSAPNTNVMRIHTNPDPKTLKITKYCSTPCLREYCVPAAKHPTPRSLTPHDLQRKEGKEDYYYKHNIFYLVRFS